MLNTAGQVITAEKTLADQWHWPNGENVQGPALQSHITVNASLLLKFMNAL